MKELQAFKRIERAHHVRNRHKKGIVENVGHHEESHEEKLKFDLRWDDLLELKERIRMEQDRVEEEEKFKETREENINNDYIDSPRLKQVKRVKIEQKISTELVKRSYESNKLEIQPDRDSKILKFAGISGVRRNNFVNDSNMESSLPPQKTTTFSFLKKGGSRSKTMGNSNIEQVNNTSFAVSEADTSKEGTQINKEEKFDETTEDKINIDQNEKILNNSLKQETEEKTNAEILKTEEESPEKYEMANNGVMAKSKIKQVYFQQMTFSNLRKRKKQPNLVKKYTDAELEELSIASEDSPMGIRKKNYILNIIKNSIFKFIFSCLFFK